MRVLSVVGARPQFVKCAVVSRALRVSHEEILIHTGQHHDRELSGLLFEQLSIPEPDENLGIAGGSHGEMTGRMLDQLEAQILRVEPDWVLIYGDTNSTLAGALASAKLHVPVAHVEAGLRSFNRRMPEEINRIVADHVSTLLLCPTEHAVSLLAKEGITTGVHNVGDVMFDSVLQNLERARQRLDSSEVRSAIGFVTKPGDDFALATIHRPENTDHPERLGAILDGLSRLPVPVLLPLHPRTKGVLADRPELGRRVGANITIVEPAGYLELLLLMSEARAVITDSGGMQKEALFVGVPCITPRDETEWIETVEAGANVIVGANTEAIVEAGVSALSRRRPLTFDTGPFGDGHAAEKIVSCLERAG